MRCSNSGTLPNEAARTVAHWTREAEGWGGKHTTPTPKHKLFLFVFPAIWPHTSVPHPAAHPRMAESNINMRARGKSAGVGRGRNPGLSHRPCSRPRTTPAAPSLFSLHFCASASTSCKLRGRAREAREEKRPENVRPARVYALVLFPSNHESVRLPGHTRAEAATHRKRAKTWIRGASAGLRVPEGVEGVCESCSRRLSLQRLGHARQLVPVQHAPHGEV